MTISKKDITAVILAGGRGQRLGGQDKGLVSYKDKPLIEHVITRIKPQVSTIIINANRNQDIYASYGYPVISDDMPDNLEYQGPLAGFSAAMKVLKTDYMVTLPCDGPLLPLDLVSRLRTHNQEHPLTIFVADDGQRLQPMHALIPVALQDSLNDFLTNGNRTVNLWYKKLNFITVDFSDIPEGFSNINTEEQRLSLQKTMPKLSKNHAK